MATDADVGEPIFYTYKQACKKLGISVSLLYKLMREGEIKRVRLAPQVCRIAAVELEEYGKRKIQESDRDAA